MNVPAPQNQGPAAAILEEVTSLGGQDPSTFYGDARCFAH